MGESSIKPTFGKSLFFPTTLSKSKISCHTSTLQHLSLEFKAQSKTFGAWSHAWYLLELSRRCRVLVGPQFWSESLVDSNPVVPVIQGWDWKQLMI